MTNHCEGLVLEQFIALEIRIEDSIVIIIWVIICKDQILTSFITPKNEFWAQNRMQA